MPDIPLSPLRMCFHLFTLSVLLTVVAKARQHCLSRMERQAFSNSRGFTRSPVAGMVAPNQHGGCSLSMSTLSAADRTCDALPHA